MKNRESTVFIVKSAVIAALYAIMTVVISPLSYGTVQCRFSEALVMLCAFTPAAIPGLTVGCLVANIFSFNPIDMICGTTATLLSAVVGYKLRKVKIGGIPWLTPLPAVIFNMVIIGLELSIYLPIEGRGFLVGFLIQALSVFAGQVIACYIFGVPVYIIINKTGLKKIINE